LPSIERILKKLVYQDKTTSKDDRMDKINTDLIQTTNLVF